MMMNSQTRFLFPPPERGRVVAEGDRVGVVIANVTPTRLATLADLPLSGGGMEFA
jgi:hypothetical protein